MTGTEQREAARQFYYKWNGKGQEDEDARSYWIDILQNILGMDHVTDRVEFEKKVIGADGNTKKIDVYIPETRVLIEQKSLGISLDKPQYGHGGKTPYEQAKEYDNGLPVSEKARWLIVSNFKEIWIYDMDTKKPEENVTKILLDDLPNKYGLLSFLMNKDVKTITTEMELSLKAGELVGKIHDRFLEQYNDPLAKRTQNSLNILCVRLVFCLYADDAGLFGDKNAFSDYISQYEPKDIRQALLSLFKVLDTPYDERADLYLDDELAAFPYCNGGLFANENIVIPKITQEIKDTLIEASLFDWGKISPTIFGAVFESTLNPETRRSGGMHYTSIENIHKVIDPLFLDDLKAELQEIQSISVVKVRNKKLQDFQDKLASLKFLDPASGSGNFLTESYTCIRKLENEVINTLNAGQITFGTVQNPIKVSIDQFYGIEINDFAVSVAKTALWIAESQMMQETEDIIRMELDFLPLKTNAHIIEGNALRLDWNDVVPKCDLNYIMGNPPFVGYDWMSSDQKTDMQNHFGAKTGRLDYVTAWYMHAACYINNYPIQCAFVSTNSITQGVQVIDLWTPLIYEQCLSINFAYRTFIWDSEANLKAHVHCVIIGFSKSRYERSVKYLYSETGKKTQVQNISPYLIDAQTLIVQKATKVLWDVPQLILGSMAKDGGGFIFGPEEYKEIVKKEPQSLKYVRRFMMGREFINNIERYCFWLVDANPSDVSKCPILLRHINEVKRYRESSEAASTRKLAETPMLFAQIAQPKSSYIAIPKVSSERRRYIPIGYLDPEVVAGDKLFIIPDGSLYHFGVLTSNVHNAWMRLTAGRLKSDYSYNSTTVYNTFPWPDASDDQIKQITLTAQKILDVRNQFPGSSFADLYDPLLMPPVLMKAHQENDKAVMQAYGMPIKETDEAACVAWLMRLYQEKVNEITQTK